LLHDVGLAKDEKGHHKATYNLIRRLTPPLGWSAEKMRWVGIVARYHQGALPRIGQKTIVGLSQAQRQAVLKLAGILRLVNAFDGERKGRIQRLQVHEHNGFFEIAAQGYSPRHSMAENVAAARHLLETVYRRPVMVKPLRAPRPHPAARS
jgi:exopolyphosphatase/guanosine-5'-triphosphate,3'-diphosphate pyrophosphatase